MHDHSGKEMNQSTIKNSAKVGCIILAAGASIRLGTPKQLLIVNNKTLLERSVEAALKSGAWPVIVVLGAYQDKIKPSLIKHPIICVENVAWKEGMASSIRCGIETLSAFSKEIEAAMLIVCDQIKLDNKILSDLIETHISSKSEITTAKYNNRRATPAVFSIKLFSALKKLSGENGARDLLNSADLKITEIDLPQLAQDIDTLSDYNHAVSTL